VVLADELGGCALVEVGRGLIWHRTRHSFEQNRLVGFVLA
jgi:hypothetical protein